MNNLIRAEIYKLQRNKTFWVLIGTITGLSTLLHFLIITDWWMMDGNAFDSAGLSELNALSTFTVPLFFNLIVCTLAGFYISTEFSQSGAIKNQIISGNKRTHIFIAKFLVFSFGSVLITVVIPLLTAIITVILFGQGEIFNVTTLMYLGRGFSLFTLQLLGFTSIIMLIAIVTEDSGKMIIFSIIFSLLIDVVRVFSDLSPFLAVLYNNTIFYQFSEVFKYTMTNGEMIKSLLIGGITCMFITLWGVFNFKRKEIK